MTNTEEGRSGAKAESGVTPDPLDRESPLIAGGGPSSSEPEPQVESTPLGAVASEPASSQPLAPVAKVAGERSRLGLFSAVAVGAILVLGVVFGLRLYDQSKSPAADLDARFAAGDARADSIERKSDASAAAWRSAMAALEDRVGAAESAANKGAAASNSALSEMQKALAARPATVVAMPDGQHIELPDLGPLEARIDTIEQKLGSLEAALAAPKADIRAPQERENAAAEQSSHVQAIAIVAASLAHRIERGLPFADEVTALENLGVARADLASLSAFTKTGVASASALAAQFAALAPPILASEAVSEAKEGEGLVDKLARNAAALVRIHRDDDVTGKDLPSLVARIQTALARDDVEEAYALWGELPSGAKTKSESWGAAAKARVDALSATRSIEADAVAVLGKSKS